MNKNKGYTLIELLVVMAVVITSATVIFSVITATFLSVNKVNSTEQIRLAGNGIMNQLSRLISYADSFEGAVDTSSNAITTCQNTLAAGAVNSVSILVNGNVNTIACVPGVDAHGNGVSNITLNGANLLDTAKLSMPNCSLSCTQYDVTDTPTIEIQFDIASFISNSSLPDKQSEIDSFTKTIKMRNLNE